MVLLLPGQTGAALLPVLPEGVLAGAEEEVDELVTRVLLLLLLLAGDEEGVALAELGLMGLFTTDEDEDEADAELKNGRGQREG